MWVNRYNVSGGSFDHNSLHIALLFPLLCTSLTILFFLLCTDAKYAVMKVHNHPVVNGKYICFRQVDILEIETLIIRRVALWKAFHDHQTNTYIKST